MVLGNEPNRGSEFIPRNYPEYLEGIVKSVCNNPAEYNLPGVISWNYVLGGVIHHVFRLETISGENFYLKARASKFSGLPQFDCEPRDIIYEFRATELLNTVMPDTFPRVVFFDQEKSFLVLTDVLAESISLEVLLNEQADSINNNEIATNLGVGLRFVHDRLSQLSSEIRIREDSEDEFFRTKVRQKFRHWSHPILDRAKTFLLTEGYRQLVIGDLLPKNVGISKVSDGITIFDLEDVHQGNIDFEVSYLLGHIILHLKDLDPQKIEEFIGVFLKSYDGDHNPRIDQLDKIIVLATVVHRLNSIAPYNLRIEASYRKRILNKIRSILDRPHAEEITWQQLIKDICER